ncbi:DUF6456 domain-containing protein [Thalassococcus sp. BH17M4-6]|uniref:DUF6456 domain-containing protein n=1 Tax=Thalassococcus sp. BH17M4-6 TaxID=3413148 RepID=UPI003BD2E24A
MTSCDHQPGGGGLPGWVPISARHYLAHVENGLPIRALARRAGCHASTVLRQVRRIETRRDDPLVDAALRRLGATHCQPVSQQQDQDKPAMSYQDPDGPTLMDDARLTREARRILRRLCETGAVLAVAEGMENAVVVRDTGNGGTTRTGVVGSDVAQAMALKAWIACDAPGRIARYRITATGRSALNRMIAEQESRVRGFAESQTGFASGIALDAALDDTDAVPAPVKPRYALTDSPLAALARRRDKSGAPFLSSELVSAGERLREDFELSQLGGQGMNRADDFLTARPDPAAPDRGPKAAENRVIRAIQDLGPGLAEIALRCCCQLQGLETAERRMGWSARSGKIVLRIALQRLKRHYERARPPGGGLIG